MKKLYIIFLFVIASIAQQSFGQTAFDCYKKAMSKFEKGNYKAAIAEFDKAIKLNPKYFDAYCNRGIAKNR